MSVVGKEEQSTLNLYQIEGRIIFIPDENLLLNVQNGEVVTLIGTAAECFTIQINMHYKNERSSAT
ncbi:hypothetical protein FHW31_003683 [Enterobacter asburiae]|nr:hypothetical protein [Enterobacter asburiae]